MDPFGDIQQQFNAVRTQPSLDDDELIERSLRLASSLWQLALSQRSAAEQAQANQLARLVDDPAGKTFTVALCDRAFRGSDPTLAAHTWRRLLRRCGVPRAPAWWQRAGLVVGALASRIAAGPMVGLLDVGLRRETARVILPAEDGPLRQHLAGRRALGLRENLNHLGEAVLGETEAAARFAAYRALLKRDDVAYVSVKISAICSQVDSLAFEHSVEAIAERLRVLYADATDRTWTDSHGQRQPKWVNLDVEEYRDLHLTVAAFTRALDDPAGHQAHAGIAIQGYLPDSYAVLQHLQAWAAERGRQGRSQPKVRLVKGANAAMERVEAGHHGWQAAPYSSKAEVDANYKRLLDYALDAQQARHLRVGVASHNVFDIAYALLRRAQNGSEANVEFEMLEGMADHQARAVHSVTNNLLLYAPVVERSQVQSAIAYLVRRLDENTDRENFLATSFAMTQGDAAWQQQAARFAQAVRERQRVHAQSRRHRTHSDQLAEIAELSGNPSAAYQASSDSDWAVAANRVWIDAALERARNEPPQTIPVVVAGNQRVGNTPDECVPGYDPSYDPSQPDQPAYHWTPITADEVAAAFAYAQRAIVAPGSRRELLLACARQLEQQRAELIAVAVVDGGKSVREADGEISETIDFALWYARSLDDPALHDGVTAQARGVVVVAPPWNFPVSIAAGGVLAALAAGNAVMIKPAPEAVRAAWVLVNCLWSAGVGRDALQFVPSRDDDVGRQLLTHPEVAAVILTGASATARMFLDWRDDLHLIAETGGKNALLISPHADRELAAKDLVASAFGHAGQKCSAASLGILIGEVADDENFLATLRDAAASLPVGPAHDHWSRITPLIRPPGPELARALTHADRADHADAAGRWLLEPRQRDATGQLWSPGIRVDVQPGAWLQRTECFGPVLALVRARDLDHAIAIANSSAYGLTGGLHSLDEAEQCDFAQRIEVGNVYLNRTITGAVVARQPFGGWKASSFGPGAKAGGPNYVAQLMHWHDAWWNPDATQHASTHKANDRYPQGEPISTSPTPGSAGGPPASDAHGGRAARAPRTAHDKAPPDVAANVNELLNRARTVITDPSILSWLYQAAASDSTHSVNHFRQQHRWAPVPGEDNLFRYRLLPRNRPAMLRIDTTPTTAASTTASTADALRWAWRFALGARSLGTIATLSVAPVLRTLPAIQALASQHDIDVISESDTQLAARLASGVIARLRCPQPPSSALRQAAHAGACAILDGDLLANGRHELRTWLREQSVSIRYHRYGNPGLGPVELPAWDER